MKSNYKKLGAYVRTVDERNTKGTLGADNLYGLSVTKEFINTHANLVGVTFDSYKVVGTRQFAYIPDTSRRGDKIAIALNTIGENIIVSSICTVFEIVDEKEPKIGIVKRRTYDVTVTYDFYYCVPRMWLMGYNENGNPLTDDEMKEDVMPEYRNKTCTIEPQTCTGERNISVHPCRHSLLLKKMIQDFQNSGKKLEVYMPIFFLLKFLQTVVPTVQQDFAMDISF